MHGARRRVLAAAAAWPAAALALVLPGRGSAQTRFPERAITLVVPFGPGGIADLTARAVAEHMGRTLGQAVVVENKPGAGSIVASQAVAQARPDGHTLLLMSNGHAVSVGLFRKLPYDVQRDFAPLTTLGSFDLGLFVPAASRFATLAELLAWARAHPGRLNIGTITPGSTQHLAAKLFESSAGIDAVVVPYKGSPAVLAALRAGEIDLAFEVSGPMVAQVQAGAVRVLAVTGAQRSAAWPAVPTVQQAGVAGYEVASWNALAAPAGTPPEALALLGRAAREAVAAPEVQARLAPLGLRLAGSTPAELRRQADPEHGYDPLLSERLQAVLPACVRQGTRVISNMGAANPLAAGRAAQAVVRELGLPPLKLAVVTGDDVLPWLRAHPQPLLDGEGCSADLGDALISANAYLGADALLPALHGGAQLLLAGRVADPALFLAPLMHRFGWRADDWPRLGAGVCVGHLLECAAQVSGGYIAQPGVVDVPGLAELGFPLAEVQADGRAVITKLPGSGGRIDRLTVTAQLLYEIEDPAAYLQPDVTADFSAVQLHADGPDRVLVSGATGHAPPATLKATLGVREGFIGEGQIGYAGPGAVARGRLALQLLRARLEHLGLAALQHRLELVGVDALHGPGHGTAHEPYEVRARLALRAPTRAQAKRAGREVEALYLNGPGGGGGVTQSVREVVAVRSVAVPRHAVQLQTHWLEAGA